MTIVRMLKNYNSDITYKCQTDQQKVTDIKTWAFSKADSL